MGSAVLVPVTEVPDGFALAFPAFSSRSMGAEGGSPSIQEHKGRGRIPTLPSFGCCRVNLLLDGPTGASCFFTFFFFHMLKHHSLHLHQAPGWKSCTWLERGCLNTSGALDTAAVSWLLWSCEAAGSNPCTVVGGEMMAPAGSHPCFVG